MGESGFIIPQIGVLTTSLLEKVGLSEKTTTVKPIFDLEKDMSYAQLNHLREGATGLALPEIQPEDDQKIAAHREAIRRAILDNAAWVQPRALERLDSVILGAADLKLLDKVRTPGVVAQLSEKEERAMSLWCRENGLEFRFAHKHGSFIRDYRERFYSWKGCEQHSTHHQVWLDRLAHEIERRVWMTDPDDDSIVYYSQTHHQILVWSQRTPDELYKNGFALAKHSAYSAEASES